MDYGLGILLCRLEGGPTGVGPGRTGEECRLYSDHIHAILVS
jgi:hypothetical protein